MCRSPVDTYRAAEGELIHRGLWEDDEPNVDDEDGHDMEAAVPPRLGYVSGYAGGAGEMSKENHGRAPGLAVRRRDWRRIHHAPLFWVAVLLCLAAITIDVLSNDLSWRPRLHH
jgi:hypothetical protein